LVYFGRGGSNGVSEFLLIKDGIKLKLNTTQNLTEAWVNGIIPSINTTTYNRNETIVLRVNLSNRTNGDST